ncbi:hypothetical protein DESC_680006 [Desulfosarcina cetonica]|nr:hypothetical protein DESC_680006 [Desulfosarcina cetonica]
MPFHLVSSKQVDKSYKLIRAIKGAGKLNWDELSPGAYDPPRSPSDELAINAILGAR